jgi:lipoprotein-anchoring transpeptidase ErfK/SrfK
MHRFYNLLFLSVLLLTSFGVTPVSADDTPASGSTGYTGDVICRPGVYLTTPDSCLPVGPSSLLTQMAKDGVVYPVPSLPVSKPSISLNDVPFQYAKITSPSAPLYGSPSMGDARAATYFLKGATRYISYTSQTQTDMGLYFLSSSGLWVDGGDIARAAPPVFQGVVAHDTPRTQFGWILTSGYTRPLPDFGTKESKQEVKVGEFYSIAGTRQVGDTLWVMIGLGQWIEDRIIGRVIPTMVAPKGVENGRWIDINLEEQSLSVYDNSKMVFATLVSTGTEPFYTQPGLFKIYQKKDTETMSGDFSGDKSGYYYLEDVPWKMYFDKLRALHGAYWHARFGYDASHGCVNLSLGDSHWLYDWAKQGDYVYVYDPSGKTPTDPKFYTDGGA